MSDIVERLRAPAYWISGSDEGHEGDNSAPMEAARTIEILRVELAKVNMENDRLTRTNRAKREHRDKLLAAKAKDAARIQQLEAALRKVADECDALMKLEEGETVHDLTGYGRGVYFAAKHIKDCAALEEKP